MVVKGTVLLIIFKELKGATSRFAHLKKIKPKLFNLVIFNPF